MGTSDGGERGRMDGEAPCFARELSHIDNLDYLFVNVNG